MNARHVVPAARPPFPTVFLGLSGVVHPSASTYELVRGCSPWTDGHSKYEGVGVLEGALARWPDVKLVLTSIELRAHTPELVQQCLGAALATRVVGFAYEDLTTMIKRQVGTRSGTTRTVGYSSEDYWRMSKSEIVAAHVAWSRPERWVVIDDEDILWPQEVRRDRLVLTDGCEGLRSARAQDRLLTVMLMNFGR